MLQLVEYEGCTSRSRQEAHFTASAFVFDHQGRPLALFHRKLQRWLQPGGHIEPSDKDPCGAALREVQEETGLTDLSFLSPNPIDLDIHLIPKRGVENAHNHYDLRYGLRCTRSTKVVESLESNGFKWLSDDAVHQWCAEDSIARAIKVARTLL